MLCSILTFLLAQDFLEESEYKRPYIVVGSYLGIMWSLLNKKDVETHKKSGENSLTHNLPAGIIGFGDILGEHFYLGLEGNIGHGFKRSPDENGLVERIKWHFCLLGHLGFQLTPSARLYGLIGFDKTDVLKEKDFENSKTQTTSVQAIARADDYALCYGAGLLITLSPRVGLGAEYRYLPKKKWSFGNNTEKSLELSLWQICGRLVCYI